MRKGADAPLFLATMRGELEKVRLLLRHGAPVNQADHLGLTPLWAAASGSSPATFDLLIKNDAGVNRRDARGFRPIAAAARDGRLENVRLLLAAGSR